VLVSVTLARSGGGVWRMSHVTVWTEWQSRTQSSPMEPGAVSGGQRRFGHIRESWTRDVFSMNSRDISSRNETDP
jgi:hypothetical protein